LLDNLTDRTSAAGNAQERRCTPHSHRPQGVVSPTAARLLDSTPLVPARARACI
jgi:hypothetical protein